MSKIFSKRLFLFVGLLLFSALGCEQGTGPLPIPVSIKPHTGQDQTAVVGEMVPTAPSVKLVDRAGKPVEGVDVRFSVVEGGGQLGAALARTDMTGVARLGSWRLGPLVGVHLIEVTAADLPSLSIVATGVASEPSALEIQQGDGQTGVAGLELPLQPSVRVRDQYGNSVTGVRVEFQVTGGDGSLSQGAWTTDASGGAVAGRWILGQTPGPNTLSASIPGIPSQEFSATGIPGLPEQLVVLSGQDQVGTVGLAVPIRPSLMVVDQLGNPVGGVPVLFRVSSGGGSVADHLQISGPTGVVTSGPWILGSRTGVQQLQGVVQGLEATVFEANAKAGLPAAAFADGVQSFTGTVGSTLAEPPRVRVEDSFGNPIPGVGVTFSLATFPGPETSAGSLQGNTVSTDEGGLAVAQAWVLGSTAGDYSVRAHVVGLSEPVVFIASATAGSPVAVAVHEGDNQTEKVLTPLAIPPSVRVVDDFGNPVPGISVTFAIESGGGSVSGAEATSNGEGLASLGSWTLGPTPGANVLLATAQGVGVVTFRATASAGIAAFVQPVSGMDQEAAAGTPVPHPPAVRVTDEGGFPIEMASVTFSVVSGNGTLTGATATTDQDGIAVAGSWVLGTLAGPNTLSVSVQQLPSVSFSAMGHPGPATIVSAVAGDGQQGDVGSDVPDPPSVLVTDEFGNPTPDVTVSFTVTEGGGTLSDASPRSGIDGVATVGSWTLGPAPGLNRVLASIPQGASLVFLATSLAQDGFDIEVEFLTSIDPGTLWAFEAAVARWEEVVVGDLPEYTGFLPASSCQPVNEAADIDDLKVYVSVKAIDGVGGIAGQGYPCFARPQGAFLPITGVMVLDVADLPAFHSIGLMEDLITHELGHILGLGALWQHESNEYLVGAGTGDPYFSGPRAIAAFNAAGGNVYSGSKVPVENSGAYGTRDAHWRESVFSSELMSGWLAADGGNPLSAITIASLGDLGYDVNMRAADPYVLFNPYAAPGQEPSRTLVHIQELPGPKPLPAPGGGG